MSKLALSRLPSAIAAGRALTTLMALTALAGTADAATLEQIKAEQIAVLNAHLQTFDLDGADRTGYDPYADEFTGELQIQTESTAMGLYYGGVDNLGLSGTQLQEMYDFFAFMLDGDGWLLSDYKPASGVEFKKALHNAWSLAAIEILESEGIADTAGIKTAVVDVLEGALDSNGYMAGDPDGSQGLRTKFVQSLPFMFKAAQDLGDTGAAAKARQALDFYMANCVDANFDIWRIDETGAKVLRVNSHEAMEFTHGLLLFHTYDTDPTRRAAIEAALVGIIDRYSGPTWTYTNSFGEAYVANDAAAGVVNTLAHFQLQFIIEQANDKRLTTTGDASQYVAIYDRIKLSGFNDPEVDNNFYYQADPDTGASISSNINSYLPGYAIAAADAQIPPPPVPLLGPLAQGMLMLGIGALGAVAGMRRRD